MYDELIKNLRICSKVETEPHCNGCTLNTHDVFCCYRLLNKAADAIEELQKQLREEKVDNVNLTGWLAEEHANQCPYYIRNVHDRGDDSLCTKWGCEVKAFPKWIPVKERLPKEYNRVLVYSKATRMGRGIDFINADGNWFSTQKVSHWMPLPQPPKDGEP